ncbi:hypothetical protein BgiBS90_017233 [Biomphalaria glabrata]|nr:hypothetical protein BgiBS90_017233 [Biomphalaria glabrata]
MKAVCYNESGVLQFFKHVMFLCRKKRQQMKPNSLVPPTPADPSLQEVLLFSRQKVAFKKVGSGCHATVPETEDKDVDVLRDYGLRDFRFSGNCIETLRDMKGSNTQKTCQVLELSTKIFSSQASSELINHRRR